MELSKPKVFEKPDAGMFLGTIIDVVDMPNVTVVWKGVSKLVNKVRVEWVLGKLDNTPLLDSEGKPMTISGFYTATISDNSNLGKFLAQVLNAAPPLMTTTEQIAQLLIGRSGQLFLIKAPNLKNPQDPYTNISGIAPLAPGQVAPVTPTGFIRSKDRPKTVAGQATYATPQAAQQAQQATTAPVPTSAPAPTTGTPIPASNNVSF
jgi:hypothetical protein